MLAREARVGPGLCGDTGSRSYYSTERHCRSSGSLYSLGPDYPSARLVLVGPRHALGKEAPAMFGQRIQKSTTDAKAQDRVIFTGGVNNVEDYFRAADLLVFPSRREGMPNAMPEAMACGLPVITTPFLGLPAEFGFPGVHYVLTDWNTEVLAADIQKQLSRGEYRRQLGQAA